MLTTGSSLFGTSDECTKVSIGEWYSVYDKDHVEDRNFSLTDLDHCLKACTSFEDGERQTYSYG